MADVEKVARAIKELKPFEDGNENVEYILIRGLSAIGFKLPAAGAQDLAEAIAKAALAAMGERGAVLSGYGDYTPVTINASTVAHPASPRPEVVEEAVKAERERCARIAEADRRGELAKQCGHEPIFHRYGKAIAAAIRGSE